MNNTRKPLLIRMLFVCVASVCALPVHAAHSGMNSSAFDSQLRRIAVAGGTVTERFDLYEVSATEWIEFADKHNYDKKGKYHKRYQQLSPEQREQLRKRREDFQSLPPEERERIHKAREKFRNLPPEKRQELKEKWKKMSPEERKQKHKHNRKGNPHHD